MPASLLLLLLLSAVCSTKNGPAVPYSSHAFSLRLSATDVSRVVQPVSRVDVGVGMCLLLLLLYHTDD